jgi:anti-sigma B factor antagonist
MEITIEQRGGVTVVAMTGSIDALTADALVAALSAELAAGKSHLVAAMAGVDYTSSAGLRVLLGTVKEARRRGGDLRLAEVQERVHRVLELSGFTGILQCYPDVPSAVESFAGRPA